MGTGDMAILSSLLTALTRKLGDLVQALFGWSVAALFGRLTARTRLLVTIALIVAVAWPVFVVGVFFPAAATFILSFVPVESEMVQRVLRVVWIVLAVVAPIIVAVLVRAAVPATSRKSPGKTLLNAYPLTLGMAVSFLITLVTVPAVKLASVARRWNEEHVFVQPKGEDRYEPVLKHVVSAVEATGLEPVVEELPGHLTLSTRVLKVMSRGAVDVLTADNPRRIRAEALEAYLYPADLLLRGQAHKVSGVRARLASTLLERDAYVVQEPRAQELQDELGRLWDVLDRHEDDADALPGVRARLTTIIKESFAAEEITFEDWLALDRIVRRIESEVNRRPSLVDTLATGSLEHRDAAVSTRPLPDLERASLPELVVTLARETKELVSLETKLAREEVKDDVAGAVRTAVAAAAALSILGGLLGVLGVAVALALGGTPAAALGVAAGLLVLTGVAVAVAVAWTSLPREPLRRTRKRLETELKLAREHTS